MRWILLLRAVNLGPTNKVPMKDLTALLEDLGHADVKTYLNSGNATFTSSRRSAKALAEEVQTQIRARLGLSIRACVRKDADIARALQELPDLPGYVVLNVLFDPPSAAALAAFLAQDWSPEQVQGNDQVLYLGLRNAAKTTLTNARIEKALGVGCTARTPATLAKMLDDTGGLAQRSSRSTTTGAWSDGPVPLRASRST
jgi:uncharacterized protein (DUF1697 family)